LGKERGVSRLGRLVRFLGALLKTIGQVDGVFAHMSPIFAIVAAPFAKARRLPLVLWYTHRNVDLKLKIATALCDTVTTASPEGFQLPTPKLKVLGHGIDPDQFPPTPLPSTDRPVVISVGRLSSIKRYELLIEAVQLLAQRGKKVNCRILGDEPPGGQAYGQQLRAFGQQWVEFPGGVPHNRIAAEYQGSSLVVNLSPTGGLDKTVLEGLFSARPVLVANQTFAPLLGREGQAWLVAPEAEAIAAGISAMLSDSHLNARIQTIRERALAAHSLDGLMTRLVQLFV
jgi:glycosyltransferase involved in cell wall biosynthesis